MVLVAPGGVRSEPLDDVEWARSRRFDGTRQCARTKRQQLTLVENWWEMARSPGVACLRMHPGWVDPATLHHAMPAFYARGAPERERPRRCGWRVGFRSRRRIAEEGAGTFLCLACGARAMLVSGEFCFDRQTAAKHLPGAGTQYTPQEREKLHDNVTNICERIPQQA